MHKHQLSFSHLQLYKQSQSMVIFIGLGAESTKFYVDIPFIDSILMTFSHGVRGFWFGAGYGV